MLSDFKKIPGCAPKIISRAGIKAKSAISLLYIGLLPPLSPLLLPHLRNYTDNSYQTDKYLWTFLRTLWREIINYKLKTYLRLKLSLLGKSLSLPRRDDKNSTGSFKKISEIFFFYKLYFLSCRTNFSVFSQLLNKLFLESNKFEKF